jgi:hypothetical protein
MARFVTLDDPEDLDQSRVTTHVRVTEQDFDLAVAALLGEREDSA